MADSVCTVSVTSQGYFQGVLVVRGTIAVSASPATYPTGGFALDFSNAGIQSNSAPLWVDIQSLLAPAALFIYKWVAGTTIANQKMLVVTGAAAQSGLAEFATGSTPAGVSGDTIGFRAEFPSGV